MLRILAGEGFSHAEAEGTENMSGWLWLGAGALLGGVIGAAIGVAAWWPVGAAAAFACGVLGAGLYLMLMRTAE